MRRVPVGAAALSAVVALPVASTTTTMSAVCPTALLQRRLYFGHKKVEPVAATTAFINPTDPAASGAYTGQEFTPREVRNMVLPLVPAEGSVNVMEVLASIPEAAAKFLRFGQSLTPDAYFSTLLGSEFQCRGGQLQFAPNSPAKSLAQQEAAVKKGQRGSRGMAPPPPPPSSFVSQRGAPTGFAAQQHLQQQTAKTTFRTTTEVLEVMVEYVPSFFVDVEKILEKMPSDLKHMIGTANVIQFFKKYRNFFDTQTNHGQSEVKLRADITHSRRGAADLKFAAGSGAADYLQNAASGGPKPPRNSEGNLIMGLAPKVPMEFTPMGDVLANVSDFVSRHPAFDSRMGVVGLFEKFPEYFQIVDGKVRVRPSWVAPNALKEHGLRDSPLPNAMARIMEKVPTEAGRTVETAELFALLTLDEKQEIKAQFRSFPRFLRMHGKEVIVSRDNLQVKRFLAELEKSCDSLASERLETDSLSPNDPIHQIQANMEEVEANWAVKALYEALPLMQAAELEDFQLLLPKSIRDALPKNLADELRRHPSYFAVWTYPDDETMTIVQRAKLTTPQLSDTDLTKAVLNMLPANGNGIDADKLLRRVPLNVQRYLFRTGLKTTIKERLSAYIEITEKGQIRRKN